MIVLSCKHLSCAFGANTVLSDVSFSLNESDRAALVGPNGAGKTTLLSLLSGALMPDGGELFCAPQKSLGVLSQHALTNSGKTVLAEALCANADLMEQEARLFDLQRRVEQGDTAAASTLAAQSERFERDGGLTYVARTKSALCAVGFAAMQEREVQTLSGGQKTTLALVKLLLNPPDILLLDEPTNHLDLRALAWLENTLLSLKSTLLVVSHDRWFLDRVTQKTIELSHGEAQSYDLPYSAYREARRKRRAVEQKHYDLQQKEIRRQEGIIAQQRQFNRERNIIAAQSREKALLRMEKLSAPKGDALPPHFSFACAQSPRDVLLADGISFSYGAKPILRDFSLSLTRGDRLFLVGEVGSGKSTLLKLLCGALTPQAGTVLPGVGVRAGYYDQENQNLTDENSVFDELRRTNETMSDREIRSCLAAFRFPGDRVFTRVGVLSGGERARLSLAKLMCEPFNLIFLDEPTNHLDMDAREALEEALCAYPGTAVVVSHDRYFIRQCASKLYYFEAGKSPLFLPDAADLDVFYRNLGFAAPKKDKVSSQKEDYLRRKQESAAQRKRENDLKHTQIEIEETERSVEATCAAIALYEDDYKRLQALYEEKAVLETKLEALYEKLFSLQE